MGKTFETNLFMAILLIISSIAFYAVFLNTIKRIINKESYKYDLILNTLILSVIVFLILLLFSR